MKPRNEPPRDTGVPPVLTDLQHGRDARVTRWLYFALSLLCCISVGAEPAAKIFTREDDVGKVNHAGSSEFSATDGSYRVTGGGENIWGQRDAFHFVWRKAERDVTLSADIHFVGEGKNAHRKACLMLRQSLDADAAYVDVAVHGDGLISLQYRKKAGEKTEEVQSKLKNPAAVRLVRQGERFTVTVTPKEGEPQPVGPVTVTLRDPIYAGLAVSSHEADRSETAVFEHVKFEAAEPGRGGR